MVSFYVCRKKTIVNMVGKPVIIDQKYAEHGEKMTNIL